MILFKRDESPLLVPQYPDGVREIQTGKHAGKVWSRANWKMFRNYFVSRAASSGMSFVHVMEATGHDSYEMVRHYFRLNEDAYRQDFKKFDSGLSGVDVSGPLLTHESNTLNSGTFMGQRLTTGEGGIRTRGTLSRTLVFETSSFSRSDTSPDSFACVG